MNSETLVFAISVVLVALAAGWLLFMIFALR
jgi:hypothetical protein